MPVGYHRHVPAASPTGPPGVQRIRCQISASSRPCEGPLRSRSHNDGRRTLDSGNDCYWNYFQPGVLTQMLDRARCQ